MKALIEAYATAITAIAKRVTLTDARHVLAAVERHYGRGTCYGYTPNTKAAFVEYCQMCIAELNNRGRVMCEIKAQKEAQEINAEIDNIVSCAGARAPIQMDGDMNWIFNAAVNVWRRLQAQLMQDAWINSDEIGRAIELEHAHVEALDIDYCVEAVKEGGGYLGGYVVQNKDASFQVLRERTTTGNPLKATYFSEEDYQQGRMKQFCFNGEIPVRLGAAVLAVAELAK